MLKAAAIQMRSGRDMAANLATAAELIGEAANAGAAYVQTPEMTTLLVRTPEELSDQVTPETTRRAVEHFADLARRHGLVLHVGSMAVPHEDGGFANRAFLFGPDGSVSATYDKIHMFDVDLPGGESWRESETYRPGERAVLAESAAARIGLGICYDLRFAALFRSLAVAGADILTAPAAFTRQTGEAHWHTLIKARAIETGSFVVAAAQGGRHEDGRETFGHALIVDPWGTVLAECDHDDPDYAIADIDLARVAEARQRIPALKHDRPFELDRIDTGERPAA